MKRKKNIKKRILCIVSTMLLAFSVNAPITVSAFQLPDAIKDYVDDYVDLGTDSDLEDIIQNVDISEEFSIIEQIIMDIMESDWYKDTDIQSRKEKIAELLAATGYIDKETVEMVPNYSDSEMEPKVLPARYPNLLVNLIISYLALN